MRKLFLLTGFLLAVLTAQARFSTGGEGLAPYSYVPAAATGLEEVLVFYGLENARLEYETPHPEDLRWYFYEQNAAEAHEIDGSLLETVDGASVLRQLRPGGYFVVENDIRHAVYVIDYKENSFEYTQLEPVTRAEDIAENLQWVIHGAGEDPVYYTMDGRRERLPRRHVIRYTDVKWDESSREYVDKPVTLTKEGGMTDFSIEAPLCDIDLEVSGDQFLEHFGLGAHSLSAHYDAVRVCTHAEALMEKQEKADNELESGGDGLTGSAPLNVRFFSHANPAADYCQWYIYTTPGSTADYLYRNDKDIDYTFYSAGQYTVKLVVSSEQCSDSASFTVTVTESSLDCPNFFSPRSTPGDNDEFRVAYKSLVKFHGRIMNRWGNLLFEWTDPSQGWDGTFRGQPVSPGVYFYLIQATGSDGVEYLKRGDINLLE